MQSRLQSAILDTKPLTSGSLPPAECARPGLHDFLEAIYPYYDSEHSIIFSSDFFLKTPNSLHMVPYISYPFNPRLTVVQVANQLDMARSQIG